LAVILKETHENYWLLFPINPEPWAVGTLSVGRRNGKVFPSMGQNAELKIYQDTIQEILLADGVKMLKGDIEIDFYFNRVALSYRANSGRRQSKNRADLTNMQKALEDAFQGILIDNDRDNVRVQSCAITHPATEDGYTVAHVYKPAIHLGVLPSWLDEPVAEGLAKSNPEPSDLSWPPRA
jgi:Holliday junction resolvase RusA-like endonuclease